MAIIIEAWAVARSLLLATDYQETETILLIAQDNSDGIMAGLRGRGRPGQWAQCRLSIR
jgi:hypothetical protein